jgi:MFS family permease
MSIAIMSAGYPIGGVVGGFVVSRLLEYYDWRVVFYFGTIATALMIPVVWKFMPESVHWLVRKRPAGVLERIAFNPYYEAMTQEVQAFIDRL